jgi:GT2 family glycosyltransferase
LIPCFNAAATLDEAVDSILRQTLRSLEIVAVDDGSADGTPEKLASGPGATPECEWSGRSMRGSSRG